MYLFVFEGDEIVYNKVLVEICVLWKILNSFDYIRKCEIVVNKLDIIDRCKF